MLRDLKELTIVITAICALGMIVSILLLIGRANGLL